MLGIFPIHSVIVAVLKIIFTIIHLRFPVSLGALYFHSQFPEGTNSTTQCPLFHQRTHWSTDLGMQQGQHTCLSRNRIVPTKWIAVFDSINLSMPIILAEHSNYWRSSNHESHTPAKIKPRVFSNSSSNFSISHSWHFGNQLPNRMILLDSLSLCRLKDSWS